MALITYHRAGEAAMALGIITAVAYEFASDDLLSMAVDRWRAKHPVLVRFAVVAVAAHWGGFFPPWADIFNADNLLHRGVVRIIGTKTRKEHA